VLSSLPACLSAFVPVAAQQLSTEAASAGLLPPLVHLLYALHRLLHWWSASLQQVPAAVSAVLHTVLPLSQQLQRCSAQLPGTAASAAGAGAMFNVHCALGMVAYCLYTAATDAVVSVDSLGLQREAAVAEMQLLVLAGWTAEMYKHHVAHQQQQQLLLQKELPVAAGESNSCSSSSKHSSRHPQQQQQQQQPRQPGKQQWRAGLLSIPAFHQDMLPLLPGGQAYLDAAGRARFAGTDYTDTGEERAIEIHEMANSCCCTLLMYMQYNRGGMLGQQQLGGSSVVVSAAAVRLLLELQLLAAGAVQRQRQHQAPQLPQQQPTLPSRPRHITNVLVLNCRKLLMAMVRALAASNRSCLPPEVLQQAGLQLLQALAAPTQQLQLSGPGYSFYEDAAAVEAVTGFSEALYVLVTAACGAEELPEQRGEHNKHKSVCMWQPLHYSVNLDMCCSTCRQHPALFVHLSKAKTLLEPGKHASPHCSLVCRLFTCCCVWCLQSRRQGSCPAWQQHTYRLTQP
jgi:hypothetical protein